jgi:hypothetical protein
MSHASHADTERGIIVLDLLDEIRQRLQSAHFSARGLEGALGGDALEPVADQLHRIRLLADGLAQALRR